MSSEQADQHAHQTVDGERSAAPGPAKSSSHGLVVAGVVTLVALLGLFILVGALANQDHGGGSRDGFCDQLAANGQSC